MDRFEAIENLAILFVDLWVDHLYDFWGIKWEYRYIFCGFQKENGAAEKGWHHCDSPITPEILPPKMERGKSIVRPFVRPQRLIR